LLPAKATEAKLVEPIVDLLIGSEATKEELSGFQAKLPAS
jgi:hypothetical protein